MHSYAITDGSLPISPDREALDALATRCGELARQGVEYILVREKQLSVGNLATVCREILRAVRSSSPSTKVLVAGRVDVAAAVGADGVNLSGAAGELTALQVRTVMPEAFVSVSCHSVADVLRARDSSADAVLFGPVFGKTVAGVEVVPAVQLQVLSEACRVGIAVFALGGVSKRNAAACVEVGATGIAGIRMFFPPQQN